MTDLRKFIEYLISIQIVFSVSTAFASLPLEKIKLPKGFRIEIYAQDVPDARQMVLSPAGILYVGSLDAGQVYALYKKKKYVVATNINRPVGVAWLKGDLFFSGINKIYKLPNIDSFILKAANEVEPNGSDPKEIATKEIESKKIKAEKNETKQIGRQKSVSQEEALQKFNPPKPQIVFSNLPNDTHHGWKYLAFGPDQKLYYAIGAPCNVCLSQDKRYAAIHRLDLTSGQSEIIAHGVRNTVGFTWHPQNKKFWFTDNNRDMMGDDKPPCELNRLDQVGEHFGYPYCHGDQIQDDQFTQKKCSEFKPATQNLGAHSAPLGLKFYEGKMFPNEYRNSVFIAEHGSWNRSKKIGYRVTRVVVKNDRAVSYQPFAEGWLDDATQRVWGRPADILFMPDGSMLLSDDHAAAIYRIFYQP